eukprot:6433519-Karenia_brevis.AAC.1
MVRHRRLLQRAERTNFPAVLCRLAIQLYRAKRHLKLGSMVAESGIRPNRGVAPGCTFAMTLIKVYVVEDMDRFVSQHPRVAFDMYVDDITLSRQGSTERVITDIDEAADELHAVIQQELKAELAYAKAAVVASSACISRRIKKALGERGGSCVTSTIGLGVDFAAGTRQH